MKMSTQLSHCCWVRKTNTRATEQSEKFHVRRGIHRSSVSWTIHKHLCLVCFTSSRTRRCFMLLCHSSCRSIKCMSRSMKSLLNGFCVVGQLFPSRWWFQLSSQSWVVRSSRHGVHLAIPVATEQSWSEPGRLQNQGFDTGACLQDSCQRRQSAETVGHFTFWRRPWLSLLAQTKH